MELSQKNIKIISVAVVGLLLLIFIYRKFIRKPIALVPVPAPAKEKNKWTKTTAAQDVSGSNDPSEAKRKGAVSKNADTTTLDAGAGGSESDEDENDENLPKTDATADLSTQVSNLGGGFDSAGDKNDENLPRTDATTDISIKSVALKKPDGHQSSTTIISPTPAEQYEKLKAELIELSGGSMDSRTFSRVDPVFSVNVSPQLVHRDDLERAIADQALDFLGKIYAKYKINSEKVLSIIIELSLLTMKELALGYGHTETLSKSAGDYLISKMCINIIERSCNEDELPEAIEQVSAVVNAFKNAYPDMMLSDTQRREIATELFSSCIARRTYETQKAVDDVAHSKDCLNACLDKLLPDGVNATEYKEYGYVKTLFLPQDIVTIILYAVNISNEKNITRDDFIRDQDIKLCASPKEALSARFYRMKLKLEVLLSDEEKKQRDWYGLLSMPLGSEESRAHNQHGTLRTEDLYYLERLFKSIDINRPQVLSAIKSIYEIKLRLTDKIKDETAKAKTVGKSENDQELNNLVRKKVASLFLSYITSYHEERKKKGSVPQIDEFLQWMKVLYEKFFVESIGSNVPTVFSVFTLDQVCEMAGSIYSIYYISNDKEFEKYLLTGGLSGNFNDLIQAQKELGKKLEDLRNEKLRIDAEPLPVNDYENEEYREARYKYVSNYLYNAQSPKHAEAKKSYDSFRKKVLSAQTALKYIAGPETHNRQGFIEQMKEFDKEARTAEVEIKILEIEGQLNGLKNGKDTSIGEGRDIRYIRSERHCLVEQKKREINCFFEGLSLGEKDSIRHELDRLQIKILVSVLSIPGILPDEQLSKGMCKLELMRLYNSMDFRLEAARTRGSWVTSVGRILS